MNSVWAAAGAVLTASILGLVFLISRIAFMFTVVLAVTMLGVVVFHDMRKGEEFSKSVKRRLLGFFGLVSYLMP